MIFGIVKLNRVRTRGFCFKLKIVRDGLPRIIFFRQMCAYTICFFRFLYVKFACYSIIMKKFAKIISWILVAIGAIAAALTYLLTHLS